MFRKNILMMVLSIIMILAVLSGCTSFPANTATATSSVVAVNVDPTSSQCTDSKDNSHTELFAESQPTDQPTDQPTENPSQNSSSANEKQSSATVSKETASVKPSPSIGDWQCPDPNQHPHYHMLVEVCGSMSAHDYLIAMEPELTQREEAAEKAKKKQEQENAEKHAADPVHWNADGTYNYPEGYDGNTWCRTCNRPDGNGHNGTCLFIFGKGHFNCDDTSKTCPYCGRYFGNGYNGTCYLTRAEDKKIFCYHYDEGMRYYHGKNPEPIN